MYYQPHSGISPSNLQSSQEKLLGQQQYQYNPTYSSDSNPKSQDYQHRLNMPYIETVQQKQIKTKKTTHDDVTNLNGNTYTNGTANGKGSSQFDFIPIRKRQDIMKQYESNSSSSGYKQHNTDYIVGNINRDQNEYDTNNNIKQYKNNRYQQQQQQYEKQKISLRPFQKKTNLHEQQSNAISVITNTLDVANHDNDIGDHSGYNSFMVRSQSGKMRDEKAKEMIKSSYNANTRKGSYDNQRKYENQRNANNQNSLSISNSNNSAVYDTTSVINPSILSPSSNPPFFPKPQTSSTDPIHKQLLQTSYTKIQQLLLRQRSLQQQSHALQQQNQSLHTDYRILKKTFYQKTQHIEQYQELLSFILKQLVCRLIINQGLLEDMQLQEIVREIQRKVKKYYLLGNRVGQQQLLKFIVNLTKIVEYSNNNQISSKSNKKSKSKQSSLKQSKTQYYNFEIQQKQQQQQQQQTRQLQQHYKQKQKQAQQQIQQYKINIGNLQYKINELQGKLHGKQSKIQQLLLIQQQRQQREQYQENIKINRLSEQLQQINDVKSKERLSYQQQIHKLKNKIVQLIEENKQLRRNNMKIRENDLPQKNNKIQGMARLMQFQKNQKKQIQYKYNNINNKFKNIEEQYNKQTTMNKQQNITIFSLNNQVKRLNQQLHHSKNNQTQQINTLSSKQQSLYKQIEQINMSNIRQNQIFAKQKAQLVKHINQLKKQYDGVLKIQDRFTNNEQKYKQLYSSKINVMKSNMLMEHLWEVKEIEYGNIMDIIASFKTQIKYDSGNSRILNR